MKAFPYNDKTLSFQQGMDLRDWFASHALPSLIAHAYAEHDEIVGIEEICGLAYALADEMMKARAK